MNPPPLQVGQILDRLHSTHTKAGNQYMICFIIKLLWQTKVLIMPLVIDLCIALSIVLPNLMPVSVLVIFNCGF